MKRKSHPAYRRSRLRTLTALVLTLFGISTEALARIELDRRFHLTRIGFLRSWDNVDGLFADYVRKAYQSYLEKQSRFEYQDLSKADAILKKARIQYNKVITDVGVLKQVARSLRVESIVRTRIYKEGPNYRFVLDWLHAPEMQGLSTHEFIYSDPGPGAKIGEAVLNRQLQEGLEKLIKHVPFSGHVTGRDGQWITVNLGRRDQIKPGDVLDIVSIESVKRHPLLNRIVEWDMTPVGKLEVHSVDEKLSFCKIKEASPGQEIARFHKIRSVMRPDLIVKTDMKDKPGLDPLDPAKKKQQAIKTFDVPRLGYFGFRTSLGSFDRSYNSSSASKSGGGTIYGARAEGQLWFTRAIFLEAALGFNFFNYSQKDVTAGSTTGTEEAAGSGRLSEFEFAAGYNFHIQQSFFGPKLWAKIGYHSRSYTLPENAAALVGPSGFTAFFIGIGGDLPFGEKWGALLRFDFGLLRSASETGFSSGTTTGTSDVTLFIGGYHRLSPKSVIRAGFEIFLNSMDFDGGDFSHRTVTLGPSILWFF